MNRSENRCSADELEIIDRVLAGDISSFRQIVEAHQDQLFRTIFRQTGDRELSGELTQDAFIRAFNSLNKFRGESALSTWLVRIALNVTSSYFGSRPFKQYARTVQFQSLDCPAVEIVSGEQDNTEEERLAQLRVAIGLLPQLYRDTLVLCSLEQRSYEEVAEIFKIPIGTVRSRLNKARLMLREMFESGRVGES